MQHHVDLCNKQLNTWMEEEVKRQKEVEVDTPRVDIFSSISHHILQLTGHTLGMLKI